MKMKKLLASALAAAMVVSSMIGTMVTSAAETVGTITAGTVEKTVGDTDTVVAGVAIEFTKEGGVVAPHNIITVALDGYTIDSVSTPVVEYAEGSATGVVDIDPDGSNLAAGKILLEAPVDSYAPTVTKITFDVTFVDADDVDTIAGTYAIVVSADDMTDVNEADIAITATNGSLVVEEAVTECAHANITYVSHVAPIEGGPNGSITYACGDCGETMTEEVFYDNTFKFATAYADYQAETILCFTFNTTAANWTGVDQTKSFAILTKDDNSSDEATPVVKVQLISELTNNGALTSNIVMSYPLAAKELNDNVARQMIVYKDGKWYSRKVGNYSFVNYATTGMGQFGDSEKTLIMDLLNYGTIAQTRFNYNVDNPANATFGAYSGSTNEITVSNNVRTENKKDRYRFNSVAASFESRAEMNFTITDTTSSRKPITDTSLVYVEVAYTDALGNPQVKVITGDEFRITSTGDVYVDFAELHATQMRQEVTVTLKASDDDSVQYVAYYSIEYYVAAQWNNAKDGAICQALIRFGDSANAHFSK